MSPGCDGGVGSMDDAVIDGGTVGVYEWCVSSGCDGGVGGV